VASGHGALRDSKELVALLANVRSIDAICCEIAYKLVEGRVRHSADIAVDQATCIAFRGRSPFRRGPQAQHPQGVRTFLEGELFILREFGLEGLFPAIKAGGPSSPRSARALAANDHPDVGNSLFRRCPIVPNALNNKRRDIALA
jgi:hypothetical protein